MLLWLIYGLFAAVMIWILVVFARVGSVKKNVDQAWAKLAAIWDVRRRIALQFVLATAGKVSGDVLEPVVNLAEKAQFAKTRLDRSRIETDLRTAAVRAVAMLHGLGPRAGEDATKLKADFDETETRAALALNRYRIEAKTYDNIVRNFPGNMIAQMLGLSVSGDVEIDTEDRTDDAKIAMASAGKAREAVTGSSTAKQQARRNEKERG